MASKFKRIKTNGGIEALKDRVKTPGTVDAGIIDAGNHPSGDATVAQIGFWNEFGTTRMPERSFMRSTIKDKKKDIVTLQKALLKKIVKGDMKVETGLGLVGEKMSDFIRQKIINLSSPPNAASTIKAKGSSNPLIGKTGQLEGSITYEVNR